MMSPILFRLLVLLLVGVVSGAVVIPDTGKHTNELICHGSDLSECYPRVFRPTDEFQVIRDDQELPKGLHVRMNLETGLKEAKLYDPSTDTDPVNAVEVVPQDSPEDAEVVQDSNSADAARRQEQAILGEMRKAVMDAPIKPPPASGGDAKLFHDSVAQIKGAYKVKGPRAKATAGSDMNNAWVDLEELCHDIYWGYQLAKDTELLGLLYDMVVSSGAETRGGSGDDDQGSYARLLGTALQNNRAALDLFSGYVASRGGLDLDRSRQQQQQYTSFLDAALGRIGGADVPVVTRNELTYMVSKLLADDKFLADFIGGSGLANLKLGLDLLKTSSKDDQTAAKNFRRRAVNLAADYLLVDDDARRRMLAVHTPLGTIYDRGRIMDVEAPAPLKNALTSRSRWCDAFNTAYDIWSSSPSSASSSDRWEYVPPSCNPDTHDVGTGETLANSAFSAKSSPAEHREL